MRQKALFLTGCLVCMAVWWRAGLTFGGTEFGGGSLAGNNEVGGWFFLLAIILGAFKFHRAASVSALVASTLSLPLYVYLVFPRPFRQVWPGEWKVLELPRESFIWSGWWAAGILSVGMVAVIGSVILIRSRTARGALKLRIKPS